MMDCQDILWIARCVPFICDEYYQDLSALFVNSRDNRKVMVRVGY